MLDVSAGTIIFQVSGNQARQTFRNEAGVHSFQRVPPNERNGRVHTSSITVNVLDVPDEREFVLRPQDIIIEAVRGSGKGGQAKQKTSSCIIATHRLTGARVRIEADRSQHQNRITAIGLLEARIRLSNSKTRQELENFNRRQQMGGVKRRTARIQHGVVVDHITGQNWSWRDYESGKLM